MSSLLGRSGHSTPEHARAEAPRASRRALKHVGGCGTRPRATAQRHPATDLPGAPVQRVIHNEDTVPAWGRSGQRAASSRGSHRRATHTGGRYLHPRTSRSAGAPPSRQHATQPTPEGRRCGCTGCDRARARSNPTAPRVACDEREPTTFHVKRSIRTATRASQFARTDWSGSV